MLIIPVVYLKKKTKKKSFEFSILLVLTKFSLRISWNVLQDVLAALGSHDSYGVAVAPFVVSRERQATSRAVKLTCPAHSCEERNSLLADSVSASLLL